MSVPFEPTLIKILGGAMLSAVLTIGGLSYSNKGVNDTQEIRLVLLEKQQELVFKLTEQLALTNTNLAVLNERLVNLKETSNGK